MLKANEEEEDRYNELKDKTWRETMKKKKRKSTKPSPTFTGGTAGRAVVQKEKKKSKRENTLKNMEHTETHSKRNSVKIQRKLEKR